MTVPRFYYSGELDPRREIFLDEVAAYHAARVLRLKEGDAMVLFNGKGGKYPARITGIVKTKVTVLTGEWQNIERESPLQIMLAQAISSADKMDLTVQKAVELGVSAIHTLATQRSVVRLSGERARAAGFESVALGRRILRTETAGIAALAAMQTLWGDF
ncbi:MAG TPA: RsmE family RNA methyltransferase [Burkholderiales bacterium]|nr:RsmE family RNA methyltransferase [Burkholderiales bacterium]